MAVEIPTPRTVRKQSIARIEISTEARLKPEDWTITVHFEDASYDDEGKIVGNTDFGTLSFTRRFGDVKDVKVPGSEVTISQLAGLIQVACYKFREDHIAERAAAEARRSEEEAQRAAEAEAAKSDAARAQAEAAERAAARAEGSQNADHALAAAAAEEERLEKERK